MEDMAAKFVILIFIGFGIPVGYFGTIWQKYFVETEPNYHSPAERKYNTFLESTSNCKNEKMVFSHNEERVPVFQVFSCAENSHKIWKIHIRVKENDSSFWQF